MAGLQMHAQTREVHLPAQTQQYPSTGYIFPTDNITNSIQFIMKVHFIKLSFKAYLHC